MIRITPRDKNIFEFIYKHGCATAKHIHLAFFPGNHLAAPCLRLFKLCSHGYLIRIPHKEFVYRLTSESLELIEKDQALRSHYLKNRRIMNQLEHDLSIIDLSFIFEEASIVQNWISAHKIVADQYRLFHYMDGKQIKTPDALFDLLVEKETLKVAVEYERLPKSKRRYQSIIEKYYTDVPVDLVLYVAEPKDLKERLLKIEKETLCDLEKRGHRGNLKLHVATLHEITTQRNDARFENSKGLSFSLNDLLRRSQKL